jgi:hypothetical protein
MDTSQTQDVDLNGKQLVTIDQAFEICGGFGRFQKLNAAVLILAMVLSQCFLYSFPFLEVEPKYKCLNTDTNVWSVCSSNDFCNPDHTVNKNVHWGYLWEDNETIDNLII